MQQAVPLECLRPGERGTVVDVDGREEVVHRLEEMGIRVGVDIRMVQPGSPCLVAVGDHRFSFRGDEVASLLVEIVAAD